MKKGQRIVRTVIGVLILLVLLLTPFFGEVQWREAAAYIVIVLIMGGGYELYQWLKTRTWTYRLAFGLGALGALLIGWVNGAVGIIGSEDNPANLLYLAVFVVGFIGVLLSRFEPRGMSYTLFAAAVVHFLVPVFALNVWPAEASWGNAGVVGVFIFSAVLAAFFVASGLLFRHAAQRGLF